MYINAARWKQTSAFYSDLNSGKRPQNCAWKFSGGVNTSTRSPFCRYSRLISFGLTRMFYGNLNRGQAGKVPANVQMSRASSAKIYVLTNSTSREVQENGHTSVHVCKAAVLSSCIIAMN